MKPQSAKAKGRNLQKYVVSKVLHYFPHLKPDDCLSRSMGASGEDIMLSPAARDVFPVSIECKNKKAIAIYKDYEQATANSNTYQPILIVKQNNSKPLAVMDFEYWLELVSRIT